MKIKNQYFSATLFAAHIWTATLFGRLLHSFWWGLFLFGLLYCVLYSISLRDRKWR